MVSLPTALTNIQVCVDCGGHLSLSEKTFHCQTCERDYLQNSAGVWDFRTQSAKHKLPDIFEEETFHEWLRVFQHQESKAWVIYKNSVYRFFAQAGHRILGQRIKKQINAGDLILEIGAGTGALINFVPSENFVAVDMSMESLAVIKTNWPNVTCICASASALPFKSESFQHLVSLHTLEHLYFLAESLQEMRRVMQPEGIMHYGIPTEGGLAFLLGRKLITGPHLRKTYGLDVDYVMDREHINDAPRVIKFLRMHFEGLSRRFWPIPFLRFLSLNALIYGECRKSAEHSRHD